MTSAMNEDCNATINRIYPRIDLSEIERLVYETEGLSELQKEFYSVYICARYDKILTPAFEIVTEQKNGLTLK